MTEPRTLTGVIELIRSRREVTYDAGTPGQVIDDYRRGKLDAYDHVLELLNGLAAAVGARATLTTTEGVVVGYGNLEADAWADTFWTFVRGPAFERARMRREAPLDDAINAGAKDRDAAAVAFELVAILEDLVRVVSARELVTAERLEELRAGLYEALR